MKEFIDFLNNKKSMLYNIKNDLFKVKKAYNELNKISLENYDDFINIIDDIEDLKAKIPSLESFKINKDLSSKFTLEALERKMKDLLEEFSEVANESFSIKEHSLEANRVLDNMYKNNSLTMISKELVNDINDKFEDILEGPISNNYMEKIIEPFNSLKNKDNKINIQNNNLLTTVVVDTLNNSIEIKELDLESSLENETIDKENTNKEDNKDNENISLESKLEHEEIENNNINIRNNSFISYSLENKDLNNKEINEEEKTNNILNKEDISKLKDKIVKNSFDIESIILLDYLTYC